MKNGFNIETIEYGIRGSDKPNSLGDYTVFENETNALIKVYSFFRANKIKFNYNFR